MDYFYVDAFTFDVNMKDGLYEIYGSDLKCADKGVECHFNHPCNDADFLKTNLKKVLLSFTNYNIIKSILFLFIIKCKNNYYLSNNYRQID